MTDPAGFRLLEHTADMGIEAWADRLEELFAVAAAGLRFLMFGDCRAAAELTVNVSLRAADELELLVAWLNEIIYQVEVKHLVPADFQIVRVANGRLQARISGARFDPRRHMVERQAKAATYHQLLLEQRPAGWHARVYVDL